MLRSLTLPASWRAVLDTFRPAFRRSSMYERDMIVTLDNVGQLRAVVCFARSGRMEHGGKGAKTMRTEVPAGPGAPPSNIAAMLCGYGDCYSYALAKVSGQPLLFKGDDFARTDIRMVLAG